MMRHLELTYEDILEEENSIPQLLHDKNIFTNAVGESED